MALADILAALFSARGTWTIAQGLIEGIGVLPDGVRVNILGVVEGAELGIDNIAVIAGRALAIARLRDRAPILVLVHSGGQRMSKRDELLGLSEYLAHLAKALMLAEYAGHRTIGLLYGGSAAGAFIATALATNMLVALPSAYPSVMDLPAMARVTKIPLTVLKAKARSTAVFAPGLANMIKVGAIVEEWDPGKSLAAQFATLLSMPPKDLDHRDQLGETRRGRMKAAALAARVADLACTDG